MPLSISEVIAKVDTQADPEIGVVRDGSIIYLVLNNKDDYTFNTERVAKLDAMLDHIKEMHKEGEAACMVTISAGAKKFCTGFDLSHWKKGSTTQILSFISIMPVLRKIITMPMATLAVC